jgi:hypothetical protein
VLGLSRASILWSGLRLTDNGCLQFTNLQMLERFSHAGQVTGIERALSAWESDMDPRSVLTGRM